MIPKLLTFGSVTDLKEKFGFDWPHKEIDMKFDVELGPNWIDLTEYNPKLDYIKLMDHYNKTGKWYGNSTERELEEFDWYR